MKRILRRSSDILGKDSRKKNVAVILLNSKFSNISNNERFGMLWNKAGLRICADGGANALFDEDEKRIVPDVIKGDMDSAREEVLKYFKNQGTQVIRDPNQDTNDFGKCLEELKERFDENALLWDVVVWGALGGRMDHEMCNISYLYEWTSYFRTLTLLSDQNLVCLLNGPGRFVIEPDLSAEGPICGVLPVGLPCERVTTKGLKWNMHNQRLAFGEMVSSSNEIVDSTVEIECSSPVLWMTELHPRRRISRI